MAELNKNLTNVRFNFLIHTVLRRKVQAIT